MEHGAGHYTQAVWANTYMVGCGYVHFDKGNWFVTITVCNFAPGGNLDGDRDGMYEEGKACSKCGEGLRCEDGLCIMIKF